jgi:hypothetical protein
MAKYFYIGCTAANGRGGRAELLHVFDNFADGFDWLAQLASLIDVKVQLNDQGTTVAIVSNVRNTQHWYIQRLEK